MIKTELKKNFTWGFVLSEQDLRRIVQTCQEHFFKEVSEDDCQQIITAKLQDGTIVESHSVDDILALENSGSRKIERVSLKFSEKTSDGDDEFDFDKSDWSIHIRFQDASFKTTAWTSISYSITGKTRDWVFLASSDIEERIKKTKVLAFNNIVENRWFTMFPFFAGMLLFMFLGFRFVYSDSPSKLLEQAYNSGEIADPIEALIFLERAKEASQSSPRFFLIFLGSVMIPLLLFWGFSKILPWIAPSYNFYWGDHIVFLDKRKNVQNIFWTVIVLGIIVSIVSGLILENMR